MNNASGNHADMPSLSDQTIIVTGGNSGIGFESARVFARAGARVVLACRNMAKAQHAADLICTETPQARLELMHLDLASLDSVHAFATEAIKRLPSIDVLCNNAGVMAVPFSKTKDGFELQLGTNHLGHFALTGLLFDKIAASAPSRIVTVSSLAHTTGQIRFQDLHSANGYARWAAYSQSKVANLLFAYELDRRLRARKLDVKSVACHPGISSSNLYKGGAFWLRTALLIAQSSKRGALPEIYAAVDPRVQGGDYIGPSGIMEARGLPAKVQSSALSHDPEIAKWLWSASEELTG
ncbi:MAG: oxidoreductase, partial [Chloroflexota bacterium]